MSDVQESPPAQARTRGSELASAFAAWRRAPARTHAAALLVLTSVLAVRYQSVVLAPGVGDDEGAYLQAFSLIAEGRSPYAGGYFYTPAFAFAGAWAVRHFGELAVVGFLRCVNLLGMAAITWGAFGWMPWSWRRRLLAAAALLCLSPAVRLGAEFGNLSLLTIGMIFVAFLVWRKRPLVAGWLLGLSLLVKPLGPAAVLALGAHREVPERTGRRQLLAAAVAAAIAAALTLPVPYLDEMLSFRGKVGTGRNIALQRVFHSFGADVHPFVIAAAVALVTLLVVRRRPLAPAHLFSVASAASLLATPILWSHTMLLALPVQVLAVGIACERRRDLPDGMAKRYELAVMILLAAAIHFCEGVGGFEQYPAWLLGTVAAVPCLAPAVLTAYLLRTTDPF